MSTATKPTYYLTAVLNGETIKKRTNDLNAAIAALKPAWLHTEVYITVKKGKEKAERRLTLTTAKRVFQDEIARQVFINNLLIT
jgi:uncharacterized protein (DUF2225 family)